MALGPNADSEHRLPAAQVGACLRFSGSARSKCRRPLLLWQCSPELCSILPIQQCILQHTVLSMGLHSSLI